MEITCAYCGKTFKAKNRIQKYCCKKCKTAQYCKSCRENRAHYLEPIQLRICEICGKEFMPTDRRPQKYCSDECRAVAIRLCHRRERIEAFAAKLGVQPAVVAEKTQMQHLYKPKAPFYNPREVYGYRKITVTEGVDGYFSEKWVAIDAELPWYRKHTSTLMDDPYPV